MILLISGKCMMKSGYIFVFKSYWDHFCSTKASFLVILASHASIGHISTFIAVMQSLEYSKSIQTSQVKHWESHFNHNFYHKTLVKCTVQINDKNMIPQEHLQSA